MEYKQENIEKVSFEGQDLRNYKFDRCNVIECSFKNANIEGMIGDRSNFIDCDWDGAIGNMINEKSNIIDSKEEELFEDLAEDIENA